MNKIGDIVNVSNFSIAVEEKKDHVFLDQLSGQVVDYIFAKFMLLCRGFDSLYSDIKRLKAEKTQWTSTFSKRKIQRIEQVKHGLYRLEEHKFPNPPQLGEFLEWCKPTSEEIGLPSVEKAYLLSLQMNERFPEEIFLEEKVAEVIRHVISQIGSTQYRQMRQSDSIKTFEHYYSISIRQLIDGELKEVNKAIEDKSAENEERSKQKLAVKEEYKQVKNKQSAFSLMKKILA